MLDKKIIALLKPLMLKYYFKKLIHVITLSLMLWGGASFTFMIFSRFFPITFIWNKIIIVLIFSLISGFIWSLYKKPSYKETAILLDSFGLKERIVTSLDLKGKESLVAKIQKEDTLKFLQREDLKSKISLRPSLKVLLFILIFFISTIGVSFIPTKSYTVAKEREKNIEKLEEEKAKIEKVKKKIEKDKVLKLEEKKEIEESLNKIKNRIEESKDLKNIQKEIIKTKNELEKIGKDINEREMNKIAKKLENKNFTKTLAEKLKERNSHEITKEIEGMANKIKKMNKDDLEKLINELKELQKLLKNNPKLVEAFKEIRDAISQSIEQESQNSNMINQSLENLNKAINNMLNNSNISTQLAEALNSIDELNNSLNEMTENEDITISQGSLGNEGNSESPSSYPTGEHGAQEGGQSNRNNENQGNSLGNNGSGNGSSSGSEGREGSPQNSSGGKQESSDEKAKDYEKIFTPKRLNVDGESSKIHDEIDKSGQKDIIEVKKFGEDMGESIPFSEVFRNYRDSEYKRLEEEEIPLNMQEVVKEYFIKLDE